MIAKRPLLIFSLIIGIFLLAACGSSETSGDTGAAQAVQDYLTAIVEQDADGLTRVVCPDYEDEAMLEMDSFIGVEASLNEVACSKTGTDGEASLVECSGQINATYGNEQQSFDLAGRVYEVHDEGGEWLVCGAR